jgi:hypothetical protein
VSGDGKLVETRRQECLEEILRLVREVLELGMTKMELTLEIEKMQV